jgi:hypothetical protein
MAGDPTQNPFAALGLHPRLTPAELTELLRDLAEEADPDQRRRLQEHWRALTLHPEDRLRAAFFAHPHPRRDLHPLTDPADPAALLRRYRLPAQTLTNDPLTAPPDAATLTLLPALTTTPQRRPQAPPDWPELAPDNDPLLKL